MKKVLLFFILALTIKLSAQPPCPQDTIVYGGIPSGAFNWSQGIPTPQHCPLDCEYNTYNCWQLPDTLDGIVNVAGNSSMPFGMANILFLNDCRFVLLDTCNEVGHPFVAPFTFFCSLPVNSQVCVFWDSTTTDSVGVLAKSEGTGQVLLDSATADLALCWIPTSVEQRCEIQGGGYYDPYTLDRIDQLKSNWIYLKRD